MRFDGIAPCEGAEQEALFEWAALQSVRWPELGLMHHIPNGGKRGKAEAARLKRQGVRAGVPDICLPVARGGWHGLYVELKRPDGGRASAEQLWWLDALASCGYKTAICAGWEAAAQVITEYLKGGYKNAGADCEAGKWESQEGTKGGQCLSGGACGTNRKI